MKYLINWSNIKDGHKGFEKLAVKYVQKKYDERFEHTSDTRDGNKDAVLHKDEYTLVFGFKQNNNVTEEWWMEAKYSETKKCITRYRLDATLVSAILKGNVGRVIFITNINVDTQTVNDIRQALTSTACCKEVDFCTRDYIEYWLYQNPAILNDFFPNYSSEKVKFPELMLIEQVEFFSSDKSCLVFRESLRVLDIGNTYVAQCLVYSNTNQELSIQSESYLQGIIKLQPKKWNLNIGVNSLEFKFSLSEKFGYKSSKRKNEHSLLPIPAFKLGTLSLVPKRNVTISINKNKKYSIPSQEKLLQNIRREFSKFLRNNKTMLFSLQGLSGVGKSYLLDQFINDISYSNILTFTFEMSENQINNLNSLVYCINYIHFPFLPANSVTKEYLDRLKDVQFISQLYYDIISSSHSAESIGRMFSKYINEGIQLFPPKLYVNPRLIIIDNLHKTNELVLNTIYRIVDDLSNINAPFIIILSGQHIKRNSYFSELIKKIPVFQYELCISVPDCLSLLPKEQIEQDVQELLQSQFFFSNIIELLFFIEYVLDHGEAINDFYSFATLYHLFFQEKIMNMYIGRLFMDAMREDKATEKLCNMIYWNSSGIESPNEREGQKLLSYHLVKHDPYTGRLIPYHDIYTNYYRKNYPYSDFLNISFIELLECTNLSALNKAINEIHQAFKSGKYIFVYYSLEPVYRDATSSSFMNKINETEYYTLFYEYALSCTHCSMDYSGKYMFKRIYEESSALKYPSQQILKVLNAALWELTNSTFESLDYKGANNYAKELIQNTSDLISRKTIREELHKCVRYHNANIIISMIKSELQENDSNLYFEQVCKDLVDNRLQSRYYSYCIRYSLTLMQREPKKTIDTIESCLKYYEPNQEKLDKYSNKYLLWARFYLSYMKMIINNDLSEEDKTLLYMEKLHGQYYNDYRKTLLGMAMYFYYRGDVKRGDSFLLSDFYIIRKRRPRLQGFFYLASAARNVVTGNYVSAIEELKNASLIFKNIPSYNDLIKHNIYVLQHEYEDISHNENSLINNPILKYYLGGPLEKSIYYLEIRSCW